MSYLPRGQSTPTQPLRRKRHGRVFHQQTTASRDANTPTNHTHTIPAAYPTDAHRPLSSPTPPKTRKEQRTVVPNAVSIDASSFALPIRRGWAGRLADWYLACLERHPLLTKAITSTVTHIVGDVLAQAITGVPVFDMARCLRFAAYGFFVSAPANHYWHKLLDSSVGARRPTSTSSLLLKLAADQLLFAPTFTVVFYSFTCVLQGRPDLVVPVLAVKFWATLVAKWSFWPFVQLFNLRYVPQRLRVFVINVFGILWSCYVSMLAAQH